MLLKFIFFIIFAFTYTMTEAVPSLYNHQFVGTAELDVNGTCIKPGFTCIDCTTPAWCIGGLKIAIQDCPTGYSCNTRLGDCTNEEHAPECIEEAKSYNHDCKQAGIFPDPYDCQKYHFCFKQIITTEEVRYTHRTDTKVSFSHVDARCPRNYGYNPQTALCSIKLEFGQCAERLVPECTAVGQNGTLKLSSNYYYVCLQDSENKILPRIFVCPNGKYFWAGFCHEEPESPAIVIDTTTETATSTTPEVSSLFDYQYRLSNIDENNYF